MNRRLILLFFAVLVVKAIFLALDREPSFYFEDSAAYLTTAIGKWIPPDHSFVYGLLLRPVAVWPRSLMPMVVMQVALSGVASWLVGVCLVRYFGASFIIAALCSIGCAVEPLQLMRERYVLTESVATFGFAVFMWAVLSYLKTSGLSTLALIQILGALLVSLRLSFLPIVIVMSVILPLLSRRALSFWRSSRRFGINWLKGFRFILWPLMVSIILSQSLLFGYRHLYGELIHQPPAYTYRGGLSLAANIAPLIQPIDFPRPNEQGQMLREVRFPVSDPALRRYQRWARGGICYVIYESTGKNADEANLLAHETAVHALRRDPLGLLKLAGMTYIGYFHYASLERDLWLEQGQRINPQPNEAQMIKDVFGVDAEKRSFESLTKKWEEKSVIWCWFVLIVPLLFCAYVAARWRYVRTSHVVCLVCGFIFLFNAASAVEYPTPRYMTTLAWLAFIMIGCMVGSGKRRLASRRGKDKPQTIGIHAT